MCFSSSIIQQVEYLSLFSANGRHIHHRAFRLVSLPLLIQSEFKPQPLAAAAKVHSRLEFEEKEARGICVGDCGVKKKFLKNC